MRVSVWVISFVAGALVMAALRNALLSGVCLWSAIILAIVAAMKSSPKPAAGQINSYDEQLDDDNDQGRPAHGRSWRKEEEDYFQDAFDAEQREHEDRGEV